MTYPPELKSKALALLTLGYSQPRIQAMIRQEFGESPSQPLLSMWKSELMLSNGEQDAQTNSNWREIIRRAQRHTIDILDSNEFDKSDLPKLIIAAGVGTDKIHQEKTLQRGPDVHQHLTLLIQEAKMKLQSDDPVGGEG